MRMWAFIAAVSVVWATIPPALACQPSRAPEEQAASMRARQADAWDKADLVVVARIEERRVQPAGDWKDAPHVTLMPLVSLKGQAGPWQFELGATGKHMCGLIPGFDVLQGLVGQEFVVFVKGDTPMQEAVIDTVTVDALVEPRVLAALKAAE
jgi:hypothetical protein